MSIITVKLPDGLYMNGTHYERKGRWADGERVRWHDDALQPIGGWQALTNDLGTPYPTLSDDLNNTIYRDAFSWSSNSDSRFFVFGANNEVKVLPPNQVITDITPVGFVGSPPSPTANTGYGSWLYGLSNYGTARPIPSSAVGRVHRWQFDTWGEDLLLGANDPLFRGSIYYLDTSIVLAPAVEIANAPDDQNGFTVTDQRIVMCIGSDTEARIVRWSDRENFNEWTPTQLNYAGSYNLQGSGKLLSINKVLNQVLILSESDAHVARYIGAPLVYGFDRVGDKCGPWNAQSVYVTDRFAIWPSRRTFWMYDGTVKQFDCAIQDFLDDDVNQANLAKSFCVGIPQYNEVWWFYQSNSNTSGEVDSYISYDYINGTWSKGRLNRTAGVDGEVRNNPIMINSDLQELREHELENAIVQAAWAETGPLELGEGETNMAIRYVYPDTRNSGAMTYTFLASQMPTDTHYAYGPYQHDTPISTRVLGREIAMRITGDDLASGWRVGSKTRFDVAPMGTGRR